MANAAHYTYVVKYEQKQEQYIARVLEFPSYVVHTNTLRGALDQLVTHIHMVIKELKEKGEVVPEPLP